MKQIIYSIPLILALTTTVTTTLMAGDFTLSCMNLKVGCIQWIDLHETLLDQVCGRAYDSCCSNVGMTLECAESRRDIYRWVVPQDRSPYTTNHGLVIDQTFKFLLDKIPCDVTDLVTYTE